MNLARQLLGGFVGKRKREVEVQTPLQNTGSQHWPVIMPKRRTCKMCSLNKVRSEPVHGCEQCQVNLCITCFKPYHILKFPGLF